MTNEELQVILEKHQLMNSESQVESVNRTVITLCGSTKFKKDFEQINAKLTMQGNIVISVGLFGHADGIQLTAEQKEILDETHKQKIDMSDGIFVINRLGYIGPSTKSQIEYAIAKGKFVQYLEGDHSI